MHVSHHPIYQPTLEIIGGCFGNNLHPIHYIMFQLYPYVLKHIAEVPFSDLTGQKNDARKETVVRHKYSLTERKTPSIGKEICRCLAPLFKL